MYKNILLASDGSKHAIRALTQAINLAKEVEEATVTIVSVVDRAKSKKAVGKDDKDEVIDTPSNALRETEVNITSHIKFNCYMEMQVKRL